MSWSSYAETSVRTEEDTGWAQKTQALPKHRIRAPFGVEPEVIDKNQSKAKVSS